MIHKNTGPIQVLSGNRRLHQFPNFDSNQNDSIWDIPSNNIQDREQENAWRNSSASSWEGQGNDWEQENNNLGNSAEFSYPNLEENSRLKNISDEAPTPHFSSNKLAKSWEIPRVSSPSEPAINSEEYPPISGQNVSVNVNVNVNQNQNQNQSPHKTPKKKQQKKSSQQHQQSAPTPGSAPGPSPAPNSPTHPKQSPKVVAISPPAAVQNNEISPNINSNNSQNLQNQNQIPNNNLESAGQWTTKWNPGSGKQAISMKEIQEQEMWRQQQQLAQTEALHKQQMMLRLKQIKLQQEQPPVWQAVPTQPHSVLSLREIQQQESKRRQTVAERLAQQPPPAPQPAPKSNLAPWAANIAVGDDKAAGSIPNSNPSAGENKSSPAPQHKQAPPQKEENIQKSQNEKQKGNYESVWGTVDSKNVKKSDKKNKTPPQEQNPNAFPSLPAPQPAAPSPNQNPKKKAAAPPSPVAIKKSPPAPAMPIVAPAAAAAIAAGAPKIKKKQRMQKVDPSLLGFVCVPDESRINQGEIQGLDG